MNQEDFYSTLGVSRTSEQWLIQLRYRALMRRYHPDAGTEPDTARAQRINEAYEVLGDPEKRRRYDARSEPPKPRASEPQGEPSPAKPRQPTKPKPKKYIPKIPLGVGRHTASGRAIFWWFVSFYFLMAALLYLRR